MGVEDTDEDMEVLVNRVEDMLPEAVTTEVLRQYTAKDSVLSRLVEDINKGRLEENRETAPYKLVFPELVVVAGVLMRGDRAVIPKDLRLDILAVAHEGHPGTVSMLTKLRELVWWPGMTEDVKEYVATCNMGCVAATATNRTPDMMERTTPDRVWQNVSADYKGLIGGKYYLHVLVDNLSRWPEVEVTKSTSMDKLYKVLDKTFQYMVFRKQ